MTRTIVVLFAGATLLLIALPLREHHGMDALQTQLALHGSAA